MVPLWLLTLGRTLYSDTSITIPFQNIFYSLLGLLAPVALGLLIQRRRPRWAKVLVTISKVVMVLFLVFVLTVGVYANLYVFSLITVPVIGAAASLPYVGFVLGGLVAAAFRMPRRHVLTIAVETGIQNTGIAIVLLLLSLHHPESDVSIVAPIISAIFTPLPLWVAIAVVQGRKRCRGGEGGAEGEEGDARQRLKMEGEEDGGGGGVEGEDGWARKMEARRTGKAVVGTQATRVKPEKC
ncbi:ileal sodium/bile acid cotransporter-like [Babylonia areolata]|uniref:ileal sodium/bile acid cotransporter-like n=1 Tax=Babylonia areolata TaxID=304850 RepID=UPI003FD014EF